MRSMKMNKVGILGLIASALLVSCTTVPMAEMVEWQGSVVSIEETNGVVFKHATIRANEDVTLIIAGNVQVNQPHQAGGGHIDLIMRESGVESVLSSGKHIPSRRGAITQRSLTFKLDGSPITQFNGQFILRFHRGSPMMHGNDNGYNWTSPKRG